MRISTKGRYALASTIIMAESHFLNEAITLISISERLGISKIYLEQVFSLLKRAGVVTSIKGSQGGYQLARDPKDISLYEILSSVELSLFEPTEETVAKSAPGIEMALKTVVFDRIDETVKDTLEAMSLGDLVDAAGKYKPAQSLMFYI